MILFQNNVWMTGLMALHAFPLFLVVCIPAFIKHVELELTAPNHALFMSIWHNNFLFIFLAQILVLVLFMLC